MQCYAVSPCVMLGVLMDESFSSIPCMHAHTQSSSNTSQPLPPPPPAFFPTLVDVPEIWLPSNHSSHQEWITQLVTTIINSGGVTDEVLLLLKPVCQVQVS